MSAGGFWGAGRRRPYTATGIRAGTLALIDGFAMQATLESDTAP